MGEYMESTTYVSVNLCGTYTYVQIKQILNDRIGEESVKINPNGIFLNSSEFASMMYQLKAIENMFIRCDKQETDSASDIAIQTISNKDSATSCDIEKQSTTGSIKPKRKLKREDVKKETISKKIKKEISESNESIMKAYAELLRIIISTLVKNRCFGCMLNLDISVGGHNICIDRKLYIEQYFIEAMALVDQAKVAELVDCENIPSKSELIADTEWCNSLKLMLNSDL